LGIGGVGKSTLAIEMNTAFESCGEKSPRENPLPKEYHRTLGVEPIQVGHRRILLDMPGQRSDAGRWDDQLDLMLDAGHRRALIVNVASFGYTADFLKRQPKQLEGWSIDAYTDEQRVAEFRSISRIAQVIGSWDLTRSKINLRIVNFVNMAAFWYDRLDQVSRYYNGPDGELNTLWSRIEHKFSGSRGSSVSIARFWPASFEVGDLLHKDAVDSKGNSVGFRVTKSVPRDHFLELRKQNLRDFNTILYGDFKRLPRPSNGISDVAREVSKSN
jgi:hypothetical protein